VFCLFCWRKFQRNKRKINCADFALNERFLTAFWLKMLENLPFDRRVFYSSWNPIRKRSLANNRMTIFCCNKLDCFTIFYMFHVSLHASSKLSYAALFKRLLWPCSVTFIYLHTYLFVNPSGSINACTCFSWWCGRLFIFGRKLSYSIYELMSNVFASVPLYLNMQHRW